MKTIVVKNFGNGIADDIYEGNAGEFSIAKHFDILTYPYRLQPLRGMTADTANTGIGNMIAASDGKMYGVGVDGSNAGKAAMWQRSTYGATDDWAQLGSGNGINVLAIPTMIVEFPSESNGRNIIYASTGELTAIRTSDGNQANKALSFTNIGQGFLHPQDKGLYIPYDNLIAVLPYNTAIASISTGVFTLSSIYQIPCLTNYGNYLAIPCFNPNVPSINGSVLFLWDRDTSNPLPNESVPWNGQLKVLNNINGTLVGVSVSNATDSTTSSDSNSILIQGYEGGSPFLIKEIIAHHFINTGSPTVTINSNVNFVYKNRLYFSVNIVPNDSLSNTYYGLWSVGKNKSGHWTVNMERIATNNNSETGILACAIKGDFASMCHTAIGTLTKTINGATSSTTYAATSIYESLVNPDMDESDKLFEKKLQAVSCHFLPLVTGQQIVMKYRVDSVSSSDWITIFTKTSTSPNTKLTAYETPKPVSGQFRDGRNYEFQIISTGGAVVTGFGYKFEINKNQIS